MLKMWEEKYMYSTYICRQSKSLCTQAHAHTHSHKHTHTHSAILFVCSNSSDTLEYSNLHDCQIISTNQWPMNLGLSLDCFTLKIESLRSFKMTISVCQCARPNISEDLNLQQREMSHQTLCSHYIHSPVEASKRRIIVMLHKLGEFMGNGDNIGMSTTLPDIVLPPVSDCTFRSTIRSTLQSDR